MNKRKIMHIFNAWMIIWGWLVLGCACADEAVYTDVSKPIVVNSVRSVVNVRLPANPTTGYQWMLIKYDPAVMETPVSHFEPGRRDLMGAPGRSIWQFKFKKTAFTVSQTTSVILEYKRPWEKSTGERQVIRFIMEKQ